MNEQEQIWVQQARRGDRSAFSRLVEAYQRPVFNLTYRMLGDVEEAEDAAQEAFLRAYSRLGQYDPALKFSTWLFSIANHYCIDRLRKRRMTQISIDDNPVLQNLEGDDPRPERHALQQEAVEVQSMLDRLDPEYRTPLVLRYWEDLSYEEIADSYERDGRNGQKPALSGTATIGGNLQRAGKRHLQRADAAHRNAARCARCCACSAAA